MKSDKTEQLNKLFKQWKQEQQNEDVNLVNRTKIKSNNITKDNFCKDGIIDENIFEKENIKVLFIANEANDDNYMATDNKYSSRVESFKEYHEKGKDVWKGKLRERTCALYKVITNNYCVSESEIACNFAFMNLNKRGGRNRSGKHIEEYFKYYIKYIKKEIEIINPDIIVWLGTTTYDMNLHINYLGATKVDDKVYLNINNKQIPILRMCHTSRAQFLPKSIQPDSNFSNIHLGKLSTKMKEELKRYHYI